MGFQATRLAWTKGVGKGVTVTTRGQDFSEKKSPRGQRLFRRRKKRGKDFFTEEKTRRGKCLDMT